MLSLVCQPHPFHFLTDALGGANLSRADLGSANLSEANLSRAILWGAKLLAADLVRVNLGGADLNGADLVRVNLSEAKVTLEQLDKAKLLTGATMPDGSIHP